ncbi:MAG: response regulator [Nanoarchaeota archaeon]|nr:response regulator [Nanoarchaeota archaeon]
MSEKIKVLIVDDDLNICKALQRPLSRDGYAVNILTSPQEVVSAHNDTKYDIIFMDTEMPHPVGYEICAELRQQDLGVVIIGMSSERGYEKQWMGAGANHFYYKKVEGLGKDIESLIQQYLANKN